MTAKKSKIPELGIANYEQHRITIKFKPIKAAASTVSV